MNNNPDRITGQRQASEADLHEIQKRSRVKEDGGGDEWFDMSVDSAKKMLDLVQGLKPIPVDELKAALTAPAKRKPKTQAMDASTALTAEADSALNTGLSPVTPASNKEFPIRMTHKKQEYRGTLLPDGSVRSENGQIFHSPTRALEELAGAVANGWGKWKYHADGEWQIINKLP